MHTLYNKQRTYTTEPVHSHMETQKKPCPVENCVKEFTGKFAAGSLKRHLKKAHSGYVPAEDAKTQPPDPDPKARRQERNARYKAKFPLRALALTILNALKKLAAE